MMTREENERMCRVGAGTPMGEAIRRYWLPAAASNELPEPDGPPVRLQLLGQDYVGFRDSNGQVGILNELCCHRGASLVLGRVEDCGIRCIYHGWKFGVDGAIQDAPNVANPNFRVAQPAYPVREEGGIIWVYLGPPGTEPPFPHLRFMDVADEHRIVVPTIVNCNFVQVIEGFIDSSHLNTLHKDALTKGTGPEGTAPPQRKAALGGINVSALPRFEVENTEFGFQYAAIRERLDPSEPEHVRITAFIAPFIGYIAPDGTCLLAMPMSDERTLFFNVFWSDEVPLGTEPYRTDYLKFFGADDETREWWGMTRQSCDGPTAASKANNFYQDRAAMRDGTSFTGIIDFIPEDAAVCISMGPIYDRSNGEHVVPADLAVVRLRRLLLHCADLAEKGEDPVGLRTDLTEVRASAGDIVRGEPWSELAPGNRVVATW